MGSSEKLVGKVPIRRRTIERNTLQGLRAQNRSISSVESIIRTTPEIDREGGLVSVNATQEQRTGPSYSTGRVLLKPEDLAKLGSAALARRADRASLRRRAGRHCPTFFPSR